MTVVQVTVQYVDDCVNWRTVAERLRAVLDETGRADVAITYERVTTPADAERLGFVGSPTVLVDGRDPFAVPGASAGLACRLYRTPDGLAGAPTVEQLR